MINSRPPKRISILGSTGSIGRNALEVVRRYPGRFEVVALAAHSNIGLLKEQVEEFHPQYVAVSDTAAAEGLNAQSLGIQLWTGSEGLSRAAAIPADTILCAVVGAVGLRPLLEAIEAGNHVAVANKEPFVMAGRLIMEHAQSKGVHVLPVDSEHNAIFQCLHGHDKRDVRCIHLTASGGPFYKRKRDTLLDITPDEAMRHPTWEMGAKISVDSATLMNKGLEIIEAMWLFGLPENLIEVVIHPQSIVHSLVEFNDGSILAHLGITDMKFPILFALTWPERVEYPMQRLDLTTLRELTFAAPDFQAFPSLGYARHAAAEGGTAPAILNAANEAAVAAFCGRRLPFLGISEIVREVRERCSAVQEYSLEAILAADAEARALADTLINRH